MKKKKPVPEFYWYDGAMSFLKSATFKKYLLPGFVFQSVTIGGGYGTGRELVEYFGRL